MQEEASIERLLQGERTMDDDEILHSYIPAAWWEQQLAKHPMKRQMLYWQLTQPRHEDITKRLIHALKILESVLAMDPLAGLKREDFVGKFVDDDHQDDMAAELTELVFLSERSKDVVYAPKYPETGPDFRCDLVSRPIEVEVTKLSGTEGEIKSEGLRTQLDTQLYDVPSGCLISIGMLAIRTQEDLTSAYRSIKGWLKKQPAEGEHELSNGLRVRVYQTNLDPRHTVVFARSWKGSGVGGHEEQVLGKIRKKASQLSGRCPGLVVTYADLEYIFSFADTINGRGQPVFRMHPQISAVILVSSVKGEPPRTLFRNPFASHPLKEEEIDRLNVAQG